MDTAKPSLTLLRSMSDQLVLGALLDGRMTRAELAATTELSKPTVSECMRRLEERGLALDTGDRSTGRGRAGSYYTLAPSAGTALVCRVAESDVSARLVDVRGSSIAHERVELGPTVDVQIATRALRSAARRCVKNSPGPVRLAVVSATDAVERITGRLVGAADSPFRLSGLDPKRALAGLIQGPVLVDNDVHWAARAELSSGAAQGMSSFVLVHLGAGLGGAVISDGEVRRGHRGLAGEIAHVVTTGPRGRAMSFTDVFEVLKLRRPNSTAIDEKAVFQRISNRRHTAVVRQLAAAVAGVVTTIHALVEPETVVFTGSWGREPRLLESVREQLAQAGVEIDMRVSALGEDADVIAARACAVDELRKAIVRLVIPD